MYRKIRFGLPKGNLNKRDANKGYTGFLLKLAGFKMEGYKPDREVQMPIAEGERDIEFYCMKPKQMPSLLEEKAIDIAILGEDTLEERYSLLWQDRFGRYLDKKMGEGGLGIERQKIWKSLKEKIRQTYSGGLAQKERVKIEGALPLELSDLGYGKVKICWGSDRLDVGGKNISNLLPIFSLCLGFNYNGLFGGTDEIRVASAYPNIAYGELARFVRSMSIMRMANSFSFRGKFTTEEIGGRQRPKVIIYPLASNTEMMDVIMTWAFKFSDPKK